MSDYLTSIIAKSFGLVETLRPRQASPFEGLGGDDGLDFGWAESSPLASRTLPIADAPLPQSPDTTATSEKPNNGQSGQVANLIPTSSPFVPKTGPLNAAPLAAPVMADRRNTSPTVTNPIDQRQTRPELAPLEVRHETTINSHTELVSQTFKAGPVITNINQATRPLLAQTENANRPSPVKPIVEARPVKPRITPAAETPRPVEPRPIVTAAPTTVQVNIGRIEVRATNSPSATTSRTTKTTPAVMSLDEYLRQRSKGGDR